MMIQPSDNIDYIQLPHAYYSQLLSIGKRLVILAEATNGKYYDPTPVSTLDAAKAIFGSGPLIDRFSDTLIGSPEGAYLMRMEPHAFQTAWSYLHKFPFDLIYMDHLFFNQSPELIQSYIEFAKEKEEQGQLIHAFFDVTGLNGIQDYRSLYALIQSLSVPVEDGLEETGKYFSIVADQAKDEKAAAVYAGLVSSLSPEISPENKTLGITLKTEFDSSSIKELRKAGVVCFKNSLKKGTVCTSSSCAVSTENSVHKHISNFRIAQYLIQEIAEQQQELVGKTGMAFSMQESEDIVDQLLANYALLNRIKKGGFEVTSDPINRIIYTTVDIVPVFSVYSMSQTSQVRVRK
jgi:hypothetical protein